MAPCIAEISKHMHSTSRALVRLGARYAHPRAKEFFSTPEQLEARPFCRSFPHAIKTTSQLELRTTAGLGHLGRAAAILGTQKRIWLVLTEFTPDTVSGSSHSVGKGHCAALSCSDKTGSVSKVNVLCRTRMTILSSAETRSVCTGMATSRRMTIRLAVNFLRICQSPGQRQPAAFTFQAAIRMIKPGEQSESVSA